MSVMGRTIDNFNIPVCDKFRPIFLDGQLCYKVDVNELMNKVDKKKIASHGILLLLDYNLDRMIKAEGDNDSVFDENGENSKEAKIYIETLGIMTF